ncbi:MULTISPECIES: alpha/beta fold hydrolase [unclassified Microbacterium]|uniref:alpha/beta fold hydrolase n=1 Tax=unclassified Microbacterium TaxID=2609290 RepID=UPI000CFDA77E|nr:MULTISPECIES: alpha/beta hydrolase [unclassified Microbacterium]PQZ56017.1 alpha/beta hydrolase [Microbacterium sp. MYb43]PQZ78531.1 alpha/beta hydrolase [Microbacterium sp. MYb40]PRB22639.1 alpha/beta hydrolase [Microbacterium sp. MYb54]PRB26790.1 alpha/beta hydrolase [Microbacterium sp. MYb50]PRB68905.1 alpha/beta hydrolase [Microbacterium sp. MYb24]
MPAPLTLPRISWGSPSASRRALLVHGLGSSGALMWRLGDALAQAGWQATAVDLRGHGDAPRSLDYSVGAYGADLAVTLPQGGGAWDAVIGHSLGGASSTVAAAAAPEWTRRLVLIDPAIHVDGRDAAIVRRSQERAFADTRLEVVQQEHPHWHPQDQELKVDAVLRASAWAVEQTSVQNQPWDVRAEAARLTVPTHVIGADPAVYSIFTGDLADEVLAANPLITMSVVEGAGHSLHRDRPDESIRQLLEALV